MDSFIAKCRITNVSKFNALHREKDGSVPVRSVQVTLQPVFGGDEDEANREWSKWTPSGELRLTITNEKIFPMLVNGRTFMVRFDSVD